MWVVGTTIQGLKRVWLRVGLYRPQRIIATAVLLVIAAALSRKVLLSDDNLSRDASGSRDTLSMSVSTGYDGHETLTAAGNRSRRGRPGRPYLYAPKSAVHRNLSTAHVTRLCTHEERVRHMREACSRLPPRVSSRSRLQNGLVDENHDVMYCYVPKAAGTSWKNLLVTASGRWKSSKLPHVHSDKTMASIGVRRFTSYKDKSERNAKMNSTYKFMVVRHPLDRLVSAWRDKLTEKKSPYLRKMGKEIIRRYRKTVDREYKDIPRFDEFVEFIKDSRYLDRHWRTVLRTCDPCNVHWDAILRTETGPGDSAEALRRLGNVSVPIIHRHEGADLLKTPVTKDLSKYFSRVSREGFRFLMHTYGADMDVLGYVWNPKTMVSSCTIQTADGGYCC